eukprot:TRINITY_DN6682_c0_g1_i1.p1 TRINITY_DN6682_c0_g1~~TRINITY_DN6682_c0_g1_i1.p1  ORF type:complete len:1040 (-),score=261.31 TRINITY_DN6682_c0_g1_i1:154-3273(-)
MEVRRGKVNIICNKVAMAWLIILGTVFIIPNIPALEVMEQCSLNAGPNQKLATVRGTISYQIRLVNVPPDFWKEGVGTSKRIINKILKKITSYEDDMSKNLDDEIQGKIVERFKKINDENLWFDEKMQKPVDKDAFCATVDEMKAKERKVLKYTCSESEQLYGIGYHKVYEDCKDDVFLGQFSVDWSICLHAHYPWVDMTQWAICVIKSYKNDFLACFCMEEDGTLEKRSFCITKFECFLHGQGLNNQNTALVVTDSCKNSIQYFMEVNVKSKKSFKKAQQIDKLRVRALYHPESPCKDHQFSAQFDVGQLDTENLNSGIEVHTPELVEYRMIPDEPVEPMQCGMPYDDEPEEKIDPVVRQRHRMLDDIFKERMATAAVIWIPGIFFLYSYLSSEKSQIEIIFSQLVQYKVITLGLYNIAMAPTLWRSKLFSKGEIGNTEITFILVSLLFTIFWLNQKEIAEIFLFYSVAYSIVSLILANVTTKLRTRESLNFMGILAFLFYTSFALLVGYKVSNTLRTIRLRTYVREEKIEPIRKKDQYKKKNAKRKKNDQKTVNGEQEKRLPQRVPSKHKMEKLIVCSWKCDKSNNTGYVSLNCSEKCIFVYHFECWDLFLTVEELIDERHILQTPCGQTNCSGKFSKIFWFNKFGEKMRSSTLKNRPRNTPNIKRATPGKGHKVTEKTANGFNNFDDINISTSTPPISDFVTNENMTENRDITSFMMAAMDFEKLYELDRESDQPYYLNEEYENESVTTNHFGTIGGERKIKNVVKSEDSFEDCGILEDQDMFEELLGNTNIDHSDDTAVSQKSKFLSMIQKNNTVEQNPDDSQPESSNGFTLSLEMLNAGSTSLSYFTNLEADKKSENNDINLETQSLTYLSGTPGSWMMEDVLQDGVQLVGIEEESLEEEINQEQDYEKNDEDFEICKTLCPFTNMIQKRSPQYHVGLIEAAVQKLMLEVDPSSITIPHFQMLVIEKLDSEAEAVYVSDDDDEVDECLICTELLEKDLQTLEPCEHIFHLVCIKQWLGKDPSCPKCRAIVIKLE